MRHLVLPALFATTAALAVVATTAAPATAGVSSDRIRIEGTYQHVVADGRDGRSHAERDLLVTGGKSYILNLPRGHSLKSGSKVLVRGKLSTTEPAGPQSLTAEETTTTSTTGDAPAATVNERVLVVLAHWNGADAVTTESARQQFFVDSDGWFREVSYGATGLTGDVTPWLPIAGPDGGLCFGNHQQTMTQAKRAALAAGFDTAAYDRTVLYFPAQSNPDCAGYSGWASQPGTDVWLNGSMTRRTTVHELGHNLGLSHAHGYSCQDAAGTFVPFVSSGCTNEEYGDVHDAMGSSSYVGHFSVGYKSQLGWGADRVADLTGGGSASLSPLSSRTGTIGVTVKAGTRAYWVERRAKIGADAGLPSASTQGVLVRVEDWGVAFGQGLLDHTPDGNLTGAVLGFGTSWQLPEGQWLSVGHDSSDGVSLVVGAVPVDHVAPGDVTSVTGTSRKGVAQLSWSHPIGPELARVTVRLSTDGTDPALAPVVYAGLDEHVTLPAPASKSTWRALISTEDSTGNASRGVQVSITSRVVSVG